MDWKPLVRFRWPTPPTWRPERPTSTAQLAASIPEKPPYAAFRRHLSALVRATALVAVAALGIVLGWRLTHQPRPLEANVPAYGFSLEQLGSGRRVRLSDHRGETVVLVFFASWCPPCKKEAEAMNALASRYADQSVRFIGIDANDARADGLRFVRHHHWAFPVAFDPNGVVAGFHYSVANLPTTVVVNARGRIVGQPIVGRVDESAGRVALREAISASQRDQR
jgi:cytochrome c biogenesis protein CcmG/thiol:disulfide interchange protein DsbE